jgi:hypothetical protein
MSILMIALTASELRGKKRHFRGRLERLVDVLALYEIYAYWVRSRSVAASSTKFPSSFSGQLERRARGKA